MPCPRARTIGLSLTLAACTWSTAAHADPPPPSSAPSDYNAPDPDRSFINYARAFANLTFSNYAVWQVNWFRKVNWVYVTRSSIGDVLRSDFQFDYDPLSENLLLHPLQGSLDFTAARAAGLSFWESALFTPIGALEWDWFGEVQQQMPGGWRSKPSTNDFVTTGTAGILLGEALYRLSSELLDSSATGTERVLREVGAGVLSPMRAINRLYTGEAWRPGSPPRRNHPVELALDLGLDGLRTDQSSYTPTALGAVELWYGDLVPTKSNDTLDPFEYFTGYGALNLANSQLNGAQVYAQGLLYGWSSPLSRDEPPVQDNAVFGFIQNFDYQGANVARYGALSGGPAEYLEWRFGAHRLLRIGVDVDWTYLAAMNSPFANVFTQYSFSMGAAAGLEGRLELGRCGNLTLRSRSYVAGVLDGQGHEEAVGYGRLAYDVRLVDHVGLGASPTFIYRGSTSGARHFGGTSLETQIYLHVDN